MKWPLYAAAGLLMVLTAWPLYAFAISVLWDWFVVPLGVEPIGLLHAFGLYMLVSLPLGRYRRTPPEDAVCAVAFVYVMPIIALALGWGVAGLMP